MEHLITWIMHNIITNYHPSFYAWITFYHISSVLRKFYTLHVLQLKIKLDDISTPHWPIHLWFTHYIYNNTIQQLDVQHNVSYLEWNVQNGFPLWKQPEKSMKWFIFALHNNCKKRWKLFSERQRSPR